MLRIFTRLLLGFSVGPCLMASAHASFSSAVSFYRSPQSLFPSGQAHPLDLLKGKKSEMTMNFYRVTKDKSEFYLPAGFVLRDLDLCQRAVDTRSGRAGTLIRFDAPWYEFQSDKGEKSWVLAKDLAPLPDDLGFAYVFAAHGLRQEPTWKSAFSGETKTGEKYRVLGFAGDFVKVSTATPDGKPGFLEFSRVILKLDFASFILQDEKSWEPYQSRTKVRPEQIRALITRPELGILNQFENDRKLVPRSTVQIKRGEWTRWAAGELKGHGQIFWKLPGSKHPSPARDLLSTEEILERELFSIAASPKNPQKALVSAKGVFLTRDGKTWTQIQQFGQNNLPVAIGARDEMYVGGYRSIDNGQSFQPFLRWQDLTSLLETRHRRTPKVLKLSEVKSMGGEKVQISVDTGVWKAQLEGSARYGLVTDWKILREN